MVYDISIRISIGYDKDVDFKTALIEKLVGVLDGQRVVNTEGVGIIQIIDVEVKEVASD